MLANYNNRNRLRKCNVTERYYLATSYRKKGEIRSVARNIIVLSRYVDTSTKGREALNMLTKVECARIAVSS